MPVNCASASSYSCLEAIRPRIRRSTSGSKRSASSRLKNLGTDEIEYNSEVRIGIHCSTAGSLERAAIKAHELGANTFQIFSASPRMWRTKPPDREQVRLFKRRREEYDLTPLAIHDSYLINLAAPPSVVREKSIDGFSGELERALVIGAEYVVAHPGNYKGLTREQGILNVAEALVLAWRQVDPALKNNRSSPFCSRTPPARARSLAAIWRTSLPSVNW